MAAHEKQLLMATGNDKQVREEISRLVMDNNVRELSKIVTARKGEFAGAVFSLASHSNAPPKRYADTTKSSSPAADGSDVAPADPCPAPPPLTCWKVGLWPSYELADHRLNIPIPSVNLTLMHVAAYYDSLEVFVYLESIGFLLEEESADQYRPIHYGCLNGSLEVCTYILSKMPEQARILPEVDFHLIYLATTSGNALILRELFACGADIKDRRNIGNRPVQQAIKTGHVQCLKVLLEKNARRVDPKEYTPIMLAITNSQPEAIPLLLQSGEDPSVITLEKRECALQLACFQREVEVVRELCERLVNVDLPEEMHERAAVHWICQSHHPEIARIILAKGINVNRLDGDGHAGPYYMLDVGEEHEILEIFDLLLKHGLNLNISAPTAKPTNTILGEFVTSITRPLKIIEWLLAHGADPTAKLVSTGQRICDYVKTSKIEPIIELFDRFMKPA